MFKTVAKIEGMYCGMCEAHINDVVRKNFRVKKVTSSHRNGVCEIISEEKIDFRWLKKSVADTGYTVTDIKEEPYAKKSLFGG